MIAQRTKHILVLYSCNGINVCVSCTLCTSFCMVCVHGVLCICVLWGRSRHDYCGIDIPVFFFFFVMYIRSIVHLFCLFVHLFVQLHGICYILCMYIVQVLLWLLVLLYVLFFVCLFLWFCIFCRRTLHLDVISCTFLYICCIVHASFCTSFSSLFPTLVLVDSWKMVMACGIIELTSEPWSYIEWPVWHLQHLFTGIPLQLQVLVFISFTFCCQWPVVVLWYIVYVCAQSNIQWIFKYIFCTSFK